MVGHIAEVDSRSFNRITVGIFSMEQSELATMRLAEYEFADNCCSFGHSCCETLPDAEEHSGNPVVYIVTALTSSQTILREITLSQDLFLKYI
jgi:hypothetical protein